MVMSYIAVCRMLSQARDMLLCYGVRTFQQELVNFLQEASDKPSRAKSELRMYVWCLTQLTGGVNVCLACR